MIRTLRRIANVYGSIALVSIKGAMAYSTWFWVDMFANMLMMTIFVFFWKAVYANTSTVSGMTMQQTLNYILFARMLMPVFGYSLVLEMGGMVRDGMVASELLRPVDFQGRSYTNMQAGTLMWVVKMAIPLGLFAWLVFGLTFPSDPLVWGAFLVSLVLGIAVLFCFDFMLSCVAFYTTEVWGVHVMREAVVNFFSGALVPLMMLPTWLQHLAQALPFAQAMYVPLTLLTGATPVAAAPRIWLGQLVWLVALGLLSRWVFSRSVRKVTVQGG